MEIPIAVLVPFSEYKNVIEELFKTKLTEKEANGFIFDRKYELDEDVFLKDPRRTLKESIAPPQTILFMLDIGQSVSHDVVISVLSITLFELVKKGLSWLKIGKSNITNLTLDEIRKVIREELDQHNEK